MDRAEPHLGLDSSESSARQAMDPLVDRVARELGRYEHPLFHFSAQASGNEVILAIDLREGLGTQYHYEINLHQREIENPQFPWTFQKLLYDCLHDFVVEMFERNPQQRVQGRKD